MKITGRHGCFRLAVIACTIATPAIHSQNAAKPTFEVATVKSAPPNADPNDGSWSPPNRGRFIATHLTLARLIQLAYGIDASQITNKPSWLDTNLYDITAKPEAGIALSRDELRPRLQELLHQRFHLVVHIETRNARGYALVVGKGQPHLTPTAGDHFPGFRINVDSGHMQGLNWTMTQFATYLTSAAGFTVVDKTGISGAFDISFAYEPNPDADSNLQPLPQALKSATGLELRPQSIPVETIVIDSADKTPTPD